MTTPGRRGAREAVLAARLTRVRTERHGLAAALERSPGADERDRLLARDGELAAVERGLAVLLPDAWRLAEGPPRSPRSGEDAAVLADVRASAAVLALRLEERPTALSPAEERDLAAALALFRYAHAALGDGFAGLGTPDRR